MTSDIATGNRRWTSTLEIDASSRRSRPTSGAHRRTTTLEPGAGERRWPGGEPPGHPARRGWDLNPRTTLKVVPALAVRSDRPDSGTSPGEREAIAGPSERHTDVGRRTRRHGRLQGCGARCAQVLDRRSLTNPSDLPSSTPALPVWWVSEEEGGPWTPRLQRFRWPCAPLNR